MKTPKTFLRGAIFDKDDMLVFIGDTLGEADAWKLYTGWGDEEDIKEKKRQGFRYAPAEIKEKLK